MTAIQEDMRAQTFIKEKDIQMAFAVGLVNHAYNYYSQVILRNAALFGLATSAGNEYALLSFYEQTAISDAVSAAKPIDQTKIVLIAFNNTTTENYIGTLISVNQTLLDLDLTDYNALATKIPVATALTGKAFTTVNELKIAFDAAVLAQKIVETP